jgi:hypothetical protein
LDFLGRGCFRTKTPAFERWISLDFLGFSRPKLALSMGYTRFSLENFSRWLNRQNWRRRSTPCGWQDCSWGKLNRFSIFPQYIVARAMPIRLPNTKHLAPTPRHRFFERAIGASQGEGDSQ